MTQVKASTDKPNKPIHTIQRTLRRTWMSWLVYRLFAYPLLVSVLTLSTNTSPQTIYFGVIGMAWQLLVLLPALLLIPTIKKGDSPYGLIIASLVALVYLGVAGVFLFIRIYEQAPTMIWVGFALETVLLIIINIQLFTLLKRLPPMHQNLPKQ